MGLSTIQVEISSLRFVSSLGFVTGKKDISVAVMSGKFWFNTLNWRSFGEGHENLLKQILSSLIARLVFVLTLCRVFRSSNRSRSIYQHWKFFKFLFCLVIPKRDLDA